MAVTVLNSEIGPAASDPESAALAASFARVDKNSATKKGLVSRSRESQGFDLVVERFVECVIRRIKSNSGRDYSPDVVATTQAAIDFVNSDPAKTGDRNQKWRTILSLHNARLGYLHLDPNMGQNLIPIKPADIMVETVHGVPFLHIIDPVYSRKVCLGSAGDFYRAQEYQIKDKSGKVGLCIITELAPKPGERVKQVSALVFEQGAIEEINHKILPPLPPPRSPENLKLDSNMGGGAEILPLNLIDWESAPEFRLGSNIRSGKIEYHDPSYSTYFCEDVAGTIVVKNKQGRIIAYCGVVFDGAGGSLDGFGLMEDQKQKTIRLQMEEALKDAKSLVDGGTVKNAQELVMLVDSLVGERQKSGQNKATGTATFCFVYPDGIVEVLSKGDGGVVAKAPGVGHYNFRRSPAAFGDNVGNPSKFLLLNFTSNAAGYARAADRGFTTTGKIEDVPQARFILEQLGDGKLFRCTRYKFSPGTQMLVLSDGGRPNNISAGESKVSENTARQLDFLAEGKKIKDGLTQIGAVIWQNPDNPGIYDKDDKGIVYFGI